MLSTFVHVIFNLTLFNIFHAYPLVIISSVRIIDLVSHTTYVMCINFIHKWRDLQFTVDSERQIFWETLHGNFLFTLRVFARNLLRGNRRRNTFCILYYMNVPWPLFYQTSLYSIPSIYVVECSGKRRRKSKRLESNLK